MLDVSKIKKDFPIYKHTPNLTYLDSTASSLKPMSVIRALRNYYEEFSSNVFRGLYPISVEATAAFEETRNVISSFLGCRSEEIIFTRNATEGLNLVMYTIGKQRVKEGDEIITTLMEHHSNFVPWQELANEKRATMKYVPVTNEGLLDLDTLYELISNQTKILALTYVSNVLGTINPLDEIISTVRKNNPSIIIVVDAAQAIPHIPTSLTDLDCDFLAFSSHKMLGPTGVGVLWGKRNLLEEMPPFLFGGEMIKSVTKHNTEYADIPHKFEAGTPSIGEVIALKEAVLYLNHIGLEAIHAHEVALLEYAIEQIQKEFKEKIRIIGPVDLSKKDGVISFTFEPYHPHDIAEVLGAEHICIRAGHHCAMPLHKSLGITATCRASFYLYNDTKDIDRLISGLHTVEKLLS